VNQDSAIVMDYFNLNVTTFCSAEKRATTMAVGQKETCPDQKKNKSFENPENKTCQEQQTRFFLKEKKMFDNCA
jgi:hypothetical protein